MSTSIRLPSGNIYHPFKIRFPDGSLNVKADYPASVWGDIPQDLTITSRIRSYEDLFELALITDAIRQRHGDIPLYLFMPYFFHQQADRVSEPGEALSARVVANFINGLQFRQVVVCDPHSDVVPALLNNFRCRTTSEMWMGFHIIRKLNANDNTYFVAPDAGASKRVAKLANEYRVPMIQATKHRNTSTGELSKTQVHIEGDLKGKTCLLVDDICVYGGTFKPIARQLLDAGAESVKLYCTHAILPDGYATVDALVSAGIDHIYTTDSYTQLESNSNLTVFKL